MRRSNSTRIERTRYSRLYSSLFGHRFIGCPHKQKQKQQRVRSTRKWKTCGLIDAVLDASQRAAQDTQNETLEARALHTLHRRPRTATTTATSTPTANKFASRIHRVHSVAFEHRHAGIQNFAFRERSKMRIIPISIAHIGDHHRLCLSLETELALGITLPVSAL